MLIPILLNRLFSAVIVAERAAFVHRSCFDAQTEGLCISPDPLLRPQAILFAVRPEQSAILRQHEIHAPC